MAIKLVVGLGNPGSQYINTRHNVGFMFINALKKQSERDVSKRVALKSQIYDIWIKGQKVLAIKPQTFMNRSGDAVLAVMQYYRLTPQEVCIVVDDLDVTFGRLRVRGQGGAGTHNGIKSVIQQLGTQAFCRLRIGIGPKPDGRDSADFVLQAFDSNQQQQLPMMLNQMAEDFVGYSQQPMDILMNRLNPVQYLDGLVK